MTSSDHQITTVEQALFLGADYAEPDHLARDLRRADEFIRLAVCAADLVLAGVELAAPDRCGIFVGTGYGPLETNFSSLGTLIDDGEGQISPTLFSHSVYNVAAGYIARLLGILGPSLTVTSYGWPFLMALAQGRQAVALGWIDQAVVLAVEVYSDLLRDAYCREYGVDTAPLVPGAAAWVLSRLGAGTGTVLFCVEVEDTPCPPALCLTRSDESWQGPCLPPLSEPHPLAHVEALTRGINDGVPPGAAWDLSASFGRARLEFGNIHPPISLP